MILYSVLLLGLSAICVAAYADNASPMALGMGVLMGLGSIITAMETFTNKLIDKLSENKAKEK